MWLVCGSGSRIQHISLKGPQVIGLGTTLARVTVTFSSLDVDLRLMEISLDKDHVQAKHTPVYLNVNPTGMSRQWASMDGTWDLNSRCDGNTNGYSSTGKYFGDLFHSFLSSIPRSLCRSLHQKSTIVGICYMIIQPVT